MIGHSDKEFTPQLVLPKTNPSTTKLHDHHMLTSKKLYQMEQPKLQ
jgi:hypothetical protein